MARYERGDQFWDIARDGATITIKSGAIGTDGETTVETLASPALANTRWNVLLNQQGRAGWKLYKPPVEAVEVSKPLPQVVVFDARNAAMETAITDDPENRELFEVYGDWLQEQGDPRGRVIALERATRGKEWGDMFHAQLNRYVAEHRNYLEGDFPRRQGCSIGMHLGFPRRIELATGRFTQTLAKMLPSSACRFLTALRLDVDDSGPESAEQDLADSLELIGKLAPPTLRSLAIGGSTTLPDLAPIAMTLPRLREFSLVNLADRELEVSDTCMRTIVTSPWPRLERLQLELLRGSCEASHVAPLFARTDLPKLTHLSIRTRFDDELVDALLGSALGRQLTVLSLGAPGIYLRMPGSADLIAMQLVACRDQLPAMVTIEIPATLMTPPVRDALNAAYQLVDDDGHERYEHGVE